MHENLERREKIKSSSERSFGLVIAAGFLLVAMLPLWHSPHQPRWWAIAFSSVFASFALLWPQRLAMLNKLWLRFGILLSAIASPIVLGLLFYTTILPIGFLMRIFGEDPLRLRRDRGASSYWIERAPASHSPHPMKHQF